MNITGIETQLILLIKVHTQLITVKLLRILNIFKLIKGILRINLKFQCLPFYDLGKTLKINIFLS